MSEPSILLHEAIRRIMLAPGEPLERVRRAEKVLCTFVSAVRRAAVSKSPSRELELVDCVLTDLDGQLRRWKLLRKQATMCDLLLNVVSRERAKSPPQDGVALSQCQRANSAGIRQQSEGAVAALIRLHE
jgi:hypothetical protein